MPHSTPDTDYPDSVGSTQDASLSVNEGSPTTVYPFAAKLEPAVSEIPAHKGMSLLEYYSAQSFEMPNVGQSFLGFELLQELGRGTSGRVYLCRQAAMADRRVVLKVTKDLASEVQTLARLKHTNIVPIYSAHAGPGFLAICMPYYGGMSFAKILCHLRVQPTLPETGTFFVDLLKDSPSEMSGVAVAAKTLGQMNYAEAVLWIAARLAEGLSHAHDRGLVHCDVKPANLLLADDGQPMLLDFDVALDLQTAGMQLSKIGGTLQYMSTDQLELLLETRKTIDRRSDLYSLGMVLYELLTGQLPFEPPLDASRLEVEQALAARKRIPEMAARHAIPSSVEAIVRKCLAPNPADRYPSAGAFVDDVQRHLTFQPLRYAKVRSWRHRAWKWMKRNPKLASPTMFAAIAAVVFLCVGIVAARQQQETVFAETEQQRHTALDTYRATLPHLYAAQAELLNALGKLDEPEQAKQTARLALNSYGVLERVDWQNAPYVAYLSSTERETLEAEIGCVLYLMACPQRGKAPSEMAQLAHVRATECLGSKAAEALRCQQADQRRQPTGALRPQTARDRLLLACELYATGRHAEALPYAKEFTKEHPESFLGWLLLGHCESELRHDSAAVASYSACVALRANASEIYFRRGVAYFNQRDYLAALADLDLTLQFVPSHREARVFRAQTYLQLGKAREGLPDLDNVLGRPNPPVKIYFMRARLLTVCGEKDRAYADEIEGMKHAPTDEASWVERGVARRSVNHEGALEDFRQAEALNPRSFPALHNQAHVLNEYLHQPNEAIKVLDRVLTIYPDNAISLADRAQLLARQKRTVEALRDVKRVEELDRRPSMLYQMAGVYSLLSKTDATHQKAALRLLAQAFRGGFGLDQIDNDHDFDPIRETAEFGTIRAAAKTLAVAGSE